jgi:hypothetical protein
MAVALSSLRVTSDFDASGYARGAAQKVAADAQMIASDKARNAALAQADAALKTSVGGMASVSKALLDGYGAGAQFEAIIRRIGNAADRGMGLDRVNLLLDAAYRKFGLTADATRLAEQGFVSIAGAVGTLNARYEQLSLSAASAAAAIGRATTQAGINASFGIDAAPEKSARDSADAFLAQYGGLDGVLRAKAQEAGAAFSSELDARLISGAGKSARDAASTFEAQFKLDTQKAEQAGANFQRSLTEALGGGGASATSQGATFSALTEQVQRLDAIEQARAAHVAATTQIDIAAAYGIDQQAKSARDSAAAFVEAAQAEEALAAKAAALRAQINPLDVEFVKLGKDMADYRNMLSAGIISQGEFEQAQALASKRLSDVDMSMRQAATGGRVLSGELGNLGYQVNDVITGLLLGQPVFMIAAQQGGQIYQIFSRSRAGVGEFASSFISSIAGMVTPTRVAFSTIAASVGIAIGAFASYEGKINEVQRLLSGMGRASGATAVGIDAIAQQNSSPTGLSTNEARNMATALAATGKVGVEAIGPIVALGHDFAKTFGVDAKEAADILAKAFADPAKGADELNQRLGFLDANTKLLIDSLVTQGNRTEAVRVLTDKIKESIASASDVTSFWARAWTVTGNAASDFFDRVGRGADRLFNGGSGLDEKINNLTIELLSLQKAKIEGGFWNWLTTDINVDQRVSEITAEIERLRKLKQTQSTAAGPDTANKQRGLEIDAIARATLPTIDATRKLEDQTKALNQAFSDPAIGKWVSLVGGDLLRALQRTDAAAAAMKGADPIKNQIADNEAQIKALDQRSIAARAQFAREAEARRQSLDPNAGTAEERLLKQDQAARLAAGGQTALDNVERQRISTLGVMASATDAATSKRLELNNLERDGVILTTKQKDALIELAREQALGTYQIKQQTDQTNIQAATIGMSAGAAAEYTARMNLLTEAVRNHKDLTAEDRDEIDKQAKALGEAAQAAALKQVRNDISFGRQTSLLSPEDVQIAQQLKGVYPDVATALGSVEAAGLRTNQALSGLSSSMSNDLTSGLTDITMGTKSLKDGFADLTTSIIRDIEQWIIKLTVVTPLMKALQLGFNGIAGGLMGGGSPTGYGTGSSAVASANGNVFGGSNVIPFARGGAFTNQIFNSPTFFRFANGGAMNAGVMGEAGPEAVMPLRRGPDGKLGVVSNGGANDNRVPRMTVNFHNAPAGTSGSASLSRSANGDFNLDFTFRNAVRDVVNGDIASGTGMAPTLKKFAGAGASGFGGR